MNTSKDESENRKTGHNVSNQLYAKVCLPSNKMILMYMKFSRVFNIYIKKCLQDQEQKLVVLDLKKSF